MRATVLPISLTLSVFLLSTQALAQETSSLTDGNQDPHAIVNDVVKPGTEVDIDEDQDDVYEAVKNGKIRPFSELYDEVESDLYGRIIKVELEENDGEWIYELKIIHDGTIVQAQYAAATLEMRLLKGHNLKNVLKSATLTVESP